MRNFAKTIWDIRRQRKKFRPIRPIVPIPDLPKVYGMKFQVIMNDRFGRPFPYKKLKMDIKSIPVREWDSQEIAALRLRMGLTFDEMVRCVRVKKSRHGKKVCLMAQRLSFLSYWERQVRKREGYRWEKISFSI